jgi:hypothetical protein
LLAVANDLSGNYTLANNIDITTVTTWVPIGSVSTPFTGTFNGNGYTLFGPNVSSSYAAPGYHVGIFGYSSGNISNLNVAVRSISTSVMGSYYTGLLVGYNNGGAITNCRVSLDYLYSSYTVSNMGPFGVVVGCCNGGSVTDCSGSIYNQVNSGCLPIFGGIVGNLSNNGVVTRCISNSKLNFLTPAVSDVGGIVGIVTLGTVSLCCFTGTISNQPAGSSVISNAGGIAGRVISGTITNCYCNNPFNIYYTATTNSYMGGILGTGTVSTPSTITNCYTTGCVPNQLSGQIASQYANAVNCYHSGKNISIGTSVTSLELQQHSTYSGWNFGIWGLIENSTYPILYFQNGCIYWNGMGNDNNWSTPGNWNLNRLPLS